jgi:hypothetical protein
MLGDETLHAHMVPKATPTFVYFIYQLSKHVSVRQEVELRLYRVKRPANGFMKCALCHVGHPRSPWLFEREVRGITKKFRGRKPVGRTQSGGRNVACKQDRRDHHFINRLGALRLVRPQIVKKPNEVALLSRQGRPRSDRQASGFRMQSHPVHARPKKGNMV